MDRVEKVKALIDSDKTGFTKDDSDFLTNLEEAQFEKIEKLVANQAKVEKKEDSVNDGEKKAKKEEPKENAEKEPKQKADAEKPKTAEEFISSAPKELAEILSSGLKMHREQKEKLIKALIEDSRCKFTEVELESRSVDELIKLTDLAVITPDFGGRDISKPKINEDDKVPEMPALNFGKK